mmetsp:Transcript_30574/g.98226  ORF Transcript_30574/g.98226 Transcript_30574/m.98226 type:complete len:296 (-) Transcript_30574:32-919(-)
MSSRWHRTCAERMRRWRWERSMPCSASTITTVAPGRAAESSSVAMPRPAQTSNMTAPLPPSWPSAGSPTLCNARRTRQTTAYASVSSLSSLRRTPRQSFAPPSSQSSALNHASPTSRCRWPFPGWRRAISPRQNSTSVCQLEAGASLTHGSHSSQASAGTIAGGAAGRAASVSPLSTSSYPVPHQPATCCSSTSRLRLWKAQASHAALRCPNMCSTEWTHVPVRCRSRQSPRLQRAEPALRLTQQIALPAEQAPAAETAWTTERLDLRLASMRALQAAAASEPSMAESWSRLSFA